MSEQENWIDRQKRMARCKRHGLHFDPKMATGCYLCLKEAARNRVYKRPKFLVLLISTLAAALVLYQIFGPEAPENPEDAPLVGLEIPEASDGLLQKIDPGPYRGALETLEQVLFSGGLESRSDLSLAAQRLASASGNLRTAVSDAQPDAALIGALGDFRNKIPQGSFTARDLQKAQRLWLTIRGRHLEQAAWFRTPQEETGSSDLLAAEYQTLTSDLISFLQDGLSEVQYGDSSRWKDFAGDWRRRFEELAKRRPRRPGADEAPAMLRAYQDLEKALRSADSLSRSAKAPSSVAPLEKALQDARKAQDTLRDLR